MSTLTPGDGQDLLAAYKRARERRDPDAALALYADGAEHRENPFRDPIVGTNAIRAMWNDMAASQANTEFDAERVWVVGDTVLAGYHAAFTDRDTAARTRVRGFMTMELNNERLIQRLRDWPVSSVVGTDFTFKVVAVRKDGADGG